MGCGASTEPQKAYERDSGAASMTSEEIKMMGEMDRMSKAASEGKPGSEPGETGKSMSISFKVFKAKLFHDINDDADQFTDDSKSKKLKKKDQIHIEEWVDKVRQEQGGPARPGLKLGDEAVAFRRGDSMASSTHSAHHDVDCPKSEPESPGAPKTATGDSPPPHDIGSSTATTAAAPEPHSDEGNSAAHNKGGGLPQSVQPSTEDSPPPDDAASPDTGGSDAAKGDRPLSLSLGSQRHALA